MTDASGYILWRASRGFGLVGNPIHVFPAEVDTDSDPVGLENRQVAVEVFAFESIGDHRLVLHATIRQAGLAQGQEPLPVARGWYWRGDGKCQVMLSLRMVVVCGSRRRRPPPGSTAAGRDGFRLRVQHGDGELRISSDHFSRLADDSQDYPAARASFRPRRFETGPAARQVGIARGFRAVD